MGSQGLANIALGHITMNIYRLNIYPLQKLHILATENITLNKIHM
ncbi:hypothetical protein SAMN04488514_101670 [Kriegella aquimaris]|uniref:Uncharacterized protein n=1 Tax=Kriegella aquimaris TaxID=192904 RepID=A0A1G9JQM1_9FLAO|nr:hypothetical protein SAMN04488514_101670 [Kriegella aquimaris]